jgi:uncharacterized membrane protein YheB (UPF0754 family)
MTRPEIWGPAVWILFHTLGEKVLEDKFPRVKNQLFNFIKMICKHLPCPFCSYDATNFLSKININKINTKNDFVNMIYVFHNYVNKKKRKPLMNYADLAPSYNHKNLRNVIINFANKYNTKGNMQQLNETFHRNLLRKEFIKWIKTNHDCFNWGIST